MNKIPDSELEIMLVIWDANCPVNADYIMERLNKTWAKTTLLNFLTRLVKRKFLSCEKHGNIYTPLVLREDYLQAESVGFLKRLHKGSLKSLVLSLYDGGGVTAEDIKEPEQFVSKERD